MGLVIGADIAGILERTVQRLAAVRDPTARHWLAMPGTGLCERVQRRWAAVAGIAAHSQIVPLRALIEQIAAADERPFSLDRLTLAVAGALPAVRERLPLPADARNCLDVVDARLLAWARQLAEALDQGLLCRPEAASWPDPFLAALADQPAVAEVLRGHLGRRTPEAFARGIAAWRSAWERRGGVPWLWLHLDAGLPAVVMQRLAQLLQALPAERTHTTLLDPSTLFWGDLQTGRRRWHDDDDAGPVLTPLGRCAQDLHNQAIDLLLSEGAGEERLEPPVAPAHLLGRLQRSCHASADPDERLPLVDGDASLTVHACRSPLRELEVCRDRILQAMVEDPTLLPQDVLLLLADPPAYAPLLAAALQPGGAGGVSLPFRVVGGGGATMSASAESLRRLLSALRSRLDLAEIQGLVEDPLIAAAFGFDQAAESGADVVAWLADARFRWGVDGAQRAATQDPDEQRWHLAFALRRLGLGAIADAQWRDGVVDGTAPLERTAGLGLAVLAGLARFADLLRAARTTWNDPAPRTMAQWRQALDELCGSFLHARTAAEREQLTRLGNVLLPALVAAAPADLLLHADAAIAMLAPQLDLLAEGSGSAAGGITVADLRQAAGIPARLILVAGLSAASFPRRDERPGWHPLAGTRQPGDPDRRAADRHALLLALLAARERLVLTYQGGSDEDDDERPPATPLADLLAAVDRIAVPSPGGGAAQAAVCFRHGLNACSPAGFHPAAPAAARSMLASDHSAAVLLRDGRQQPYPGLWSTPLPPAEPGDVAVQDLLALLAEPCRLFVRRLGLRLPEEAPELAEGDLVAPGTLEAWQLRERLLRCRLAGDDEAALRRRMETAGDLPPGRYGAQTWEELGAKVCRIADGPWIPWQPGIDLQVPMPAGPARRVAGQLPGGWHRGPQDAIRFASASQQSDRRVLALRLGLALLAPTHAGAAIRVSFAAETASLTVPTLAAAQRVLADLIVWHDLALRLPLPWSPDIHAKLVDARKSAAEALADAAAAWTGDEDQNDGPPASLRPATRLCFRGLDDPVAWCPPLEGADGPLSLRLARSIAEGVGMLGGRL